jgi:hypothetical protein
MKMVAQIKKIVKIFDKFEYSFTTEDSCEGQPLYEEIGDHEVIIQDDYHNDEWICEISVFEPTGSPLSFDILKCALITALGLPDKTPEVGSREVYNWTYGKCTIVAYDNVVRLLQHYKKV